MGWLSFWLERQPEIIIENGTWYGPWLSAGAILISALIGAGVALHSISEQRKIARKRATLDMLVMKEWDADFIQARMEFVQLRDASSGLSIWADAEHKHSPQATHVRNSLNDYELIAIGIREGILDEELYKRWFRTTFLTDWRASREYVRNARQLSGSNRLYIEIDWLAERWGEQIQIEMESL